MSARHAKKPSVVGTTAKSKNFLMTVYDYAESVLFALLCLVLLFTFVFRVVGVVGSSMVPTLYDGDWLMVSAFDSNPQYGQVVIVTQPNDFGKPVVKRIIATENQTVDINFSTGDVFVDGELLDEPYINNPTTNSEGVQFPVTVPEGHVFVMGDNRQGSTDSRSTMIGFIDKNYILGVVKYRVVNIDDETGEISRIDFENMKVN